MEDKLFAVAFDDVERGAEAGAIFRDAIDVDQRDLRDALLQHADARFDEALPLFRRVVFRVLAQVAELARPLDFFRQLLIRTTVCLAPCGPAHPAYQFVLPHLQVRQAALLPVVQRRTLIRPAPLVVLASQEADCHGLDELFVVRFADSGIDLELSVWINDPENGQLNLKSSLNVGIWRSFQANGIQIPYPQREIRLLDAAKDLPAETHQHPAQRLPVSSHSKESKA